MNAIISLGFVAAGTNHSRVGTQLRQLAGFYAEEPSQLFCVRIAQGLLHMGKGMLTINPINSQNMLISRVGLAGILIPLLAFTEMEGLICGRHQFLLYSLCLSMNPRMLMIVNK